MTEEKPAPTPKSTEETGGKPNTTPPAKQPQEPTHEKIEGLGNTPDKGQGPKNPEPPTPKKRAYHRKPKPKRQRSYIEDLLGLE